MHVGTQIEAPEGWRHLQKNMTYHFLRSDAKHDRVLLVRFDCNNKATSKANLLCVERRNFEEAVISKLIIVAPQQRSLPPWLHGLEGLNLSQIDSTRPSPKKLHRARVTERLNHIKLALPKIDSIFSSNNPELEINSYARLCNPPQNESRFRLWLLAYICFGWNEWVLVPPFHHAGQWKREKYPEKKFGAPSIAYGRKFGHGCSLELTSKCIDSYMKYAKPGKALKEIYSKAMTLDFKCLTSKSVRGDKIFIQPHGAPVPTYDQFKYRIYKELGREAVQIMRFGKARYRLKIARSKGRFTEEISNLMERIEADAYYVSEIPKSYVEGMPSERLCVVTGRDVLSGLKIGIGFCIGSEKSSAYRMMLFTMAIPKDLLCTLFGIPYEEGEWTSIGLPGHITVDRGPGSRQNLIADIEKRFPIRGIAPSWSGQSKATVESSHRRNLKTEGQPVYFQSNLTVHELVKREIIDLMRFNHGSNANDRFDPDSDLAYVQSSPHGLWQYYDSRFRNDAQPCSLEDAVRTFLEPTDFKLRNDGVYLKSRKYVSPDEDVMDMLHSLLPSNDAYVTVTGYVLTMCIRHVWIEVNGCLIMLDAKLRIRGDEDSLWMTISDLTQWEEARRETLSAFRVHQRANDADYERRFYASTGKKSDAGQQKTGRKPKPQKQNSPNKNEKAA